MPVVSLPEPVAREEVAEVKEEVVEPAKKAPRPWYKRMWRHGPAREPVQPVVEESSPAPVKVEEAPAPKPEAAAKPVEEEKPEAAAKPDKRPWYKWWNKPKAAPVEGVEPPELPEAAKGNFSESGEPLIKVGYALRFSVSAGNRTEVAEQVKTVSDKGSISMPLVGMVVCEGLTRKEFAEQLAKLYGQFLLDPQVFMDFVYDGKQGEISPWGAVGVYGCVRQPGLVNIPPTRDLTVSRAIQLAGGMDKVADQEDITISRVQKDGSKTKILVDLDLVVKEGVREKDIKLEPGDVIYVPEIRW